MKAISRIVSILAFDSAHDRGSFDCGKPDLNDWLQTKAGQSERKANTRTFVAVDPQGIGVIGYYATTTYRLDLDEAARAFGVGKRPYPVPAVLLARLAVDQAWTGQGVGHQLMVHALSGIAEASRLVGFEIVVVHAIDPDAVTFYAKCGFTRFANHPLHLYMTTKNLRATFDQAQ